MRIRWKKCIVTGFPAPDQSSTKLAGPGPQSVGSIYQELLPRGNILFQLSEAHETAVGHPVLVAACVGASVTQDNALFDRVLAFGRFINAVDGWLRDAIVVAKAWKLH